jgi:serine/threonine protein kinase
MNEESIFAAALEKQDSAERQAFLDEACGNDAALRARVEKLLAADAHARGILERGPEPAFTHTQRPDAKLSAEGLFAGRFKLRQKLGEGGMGEVWVADQTEPVQRRVALKVVRPGLGSTHLLARFDQERQALALMDHPNIAKVLDAGVDDIGRPYFVMELIKGVPITKYCDDAKLSPRQRLELFIPVCQAVQHAHQKGIIHRDLKPSNILVALYDGKPVPKVIDFGVAKATGPRLTEQSVYTEVGSVIGTLEYMSPEQAELNNLDVDTRSDIYTLGAVLYELFTGSVPFSRQELQGAALGEMLRIIKEVDPPRPSTRLSGSGTLPSVAAVRNMEPKKLVALIRGELDWIVIKCLEKDRARRYETANGLARDLERYLHDEPVDASPPSTAYRVRKFVQRNWGAVLATTALILMLIVGVAAVVAVQAKANRDLAAANKRLEDANGRERQRFNLAMEAVGLFHGEVSKDLLLKEKQFERLRNKLLQGAADFYGKLEALLKDQDDPASRAILGKAYHELGGLTRQIGKRPEALTVHQKGLGVRRELASRPDAGREAALDVARTLIEVGSLSLEKDDEALAAFQEAQAVTMQAEKTFGVSDSSRSVRASAAYWMGRHHFFMGRLAEAQSAFDQARAIRQTLLDSHPFDPSPLIQLVRTQRSPDFALLETVNLAEARAHERKIHAIFVTAVAAADPSDLDLQVDLIMSHLNYGMTFSTEGRLTEELAQYETALAICQRLVDANPSVTELQFQLAFCCRLLGRTLMLVGRLAEARAALERALAIDQRILAANIDSSAQGRVAQDLYMLANVHRAAGRLNEARQGYEKAITMLEKLVKSQPKLWFNEIRLVPAYKGLARVELAAGRFVEAAGAAQRSLDISMHQPLTNYATIYDRASCHALLAGLAGKPQTGLPPDSASTEAATAMELLQKSVAIGFYLLADLRTDPAFDALRQRDDFKKLLADVDEKVKTSEQRDRTAAQTRSAK